MSESKSSIRYISLVYDITIDTRFIPLSAQPGVIFCLKRAKCVRHGGCPIIPLWWGQRVKGKLYVRDGVKNSLPVPFDSHLKPGLNDWIPGQLAHVWKFQQPNNSQPSLAPRCQHQCREKRPNLRAKACKSGQQRCILLIAAPKKKKKDPSQIKSSVHIVLQIEIDIPLWNGTGAYKKKSEE